MASNEWPCGRIRLYWWTHLEQKIEGIKGLLLIAAIQRRQNLIDKLQRISRRTRRWKRLDREYVPERRKGSTWQVKAKEQEENSRYERSDFKETKT